ncbi:MAG: nuclear transport factor 2 family protein [Paracoccaceae bacterium]
MDLCASFGGIRTCVEDYVTGMARGDPALIGRAMHPRAASIGLYRGALEWDDREAFAAACAGQAIGPDAPVPPWEIESVSVDGTTATVRVTNHFAGERFRDTLSLVFLPEGWRIVAKVFQHPA